MEIVDLALSDDEGGDGLTDTGLSNLHQSSSLNQNKHHRDRPEPQFDLTDDLVHEVPPNLSRSESSQNGTAATRRRKGASSGSLQQPQQPQQQLESRCRSSSSATPGVDVEAVMLLEDGVASDCIGIGSGDGGDDGGGGNSDESALLSTCPSCSAENISRRQMFTLERCDHGICPACMVANVASPSSSCDLICPVPGCCTQVVVRDLALVLQEDAWGALQARRLTAFRERVDRGVLCPGCSVWVEASSDRGGRATRGAGKGNSSSGGRGTARERTNGLLSTPQLICRNCSTGVCRFCGSKVKRHQAHKSCGCGGSMLWSASGLLELLEELVENPTDVTLTGPPVADQNKVVDGTRGSNNGGRVAGRGGSSSRGKGRIKGRGKWASHPSLAFGAYVSGGGSSGISSKWSKGTGYGGAGDTAAVAAGKAAAAEAEKRADRAMVVVFDALTSCLPPRGEYPEHVPELLALVRESSLLQLVCAYLRNDSLMDIAKRRELYQSLFKLVLAFAVHELLAPLIDSVPPRSGSRIKAEDVSRSLVGADAGGGGGLGKGKGKAKVSEDKSTEGVVEVAAAGTLEAAGGADDNSRGDDGEVGELGKGWNTTGDEAEQEQRGQEEDDEVSVADLLASANRQAQVFAQAPGANGRRGEAGTLSFALQVTEVHDNVKNSLTYLRGIAEARASSVAVKALTSAMGTGGVAGAGLGRKRKREQLDCVEVSLESRYVNELGDRRFKAVPLLGEGLAHHFASQASKQNGGIGGRSRVVRISQEVSSLATSLPVQPDSSIFLRVDEDRYDVMRALITGPKDTPYEGGCFEFDIILPPDYPSRPPQVHFLTTGRGRIRFNPNLYNTGKVCLSLLGTWAGPGWDPKTSTLLQVLISIQSLILVAEPYFNEPGFEGQLGTSHGRSRSWSYNSRIRNATLMFGVVEALERPSGPMHDVVRRHFRLMKGHLLRTARKWLTESAQGSGVAGQPRFGASDGGCGGDFASMSKVVTKTERLLSAL